MEIGYCATASYPFNMFVVSSAAIAAPAPAPAPAVDGYTRYSASFLKAYRSSSRLECGLSVALNHCEVRCACIVGSYRKSSFPQNHVGTWEEPDGESGSESDEEEDEQEQENNYDFESDWDEEEETKLSANKVVNTSTDSYEDDMKKEVEQLLEPNEKAILQQNVIPQLEKISTRKWSPLHTYALSGQISFMDKLLENGYDINFLNEEGLTALHKAIIGKKEAVISHLLRKGASPHVIDKDGATPLHYAVQVSAKQTVKLLIKHKVNLNVADNEGWTPLHIAIQSRNREIAKILLVNGADKTRRNKDGKTPLDLSLCYGKDFKSYDLAKLLKVVPANRDL